MALHSDPPATRSIHVVLDTAALSVVAKVDSCANQPCCCCERCPRILTHLRHYSPTLVRAAHAESFVCYLGFYAVACQVHSTASTTRVGQCISTIVPHMPLYFVARCISSTVLPRVILKRTSRLHSFCHCHHRRFAGWPCRPYCHCSIGCTSHRECRKYEHMVLWLRATLDL